MSSVVSWLGNLWGRPNWSALTFGACYYISTDVKA